MESELKPTRRSAAPDIVAAVSDVLVRYATGIDSRDWELFRSCFTEDCKADYSELATPDEPMRWDDRAAMAAWMEASHRDMGHTLHRITNMRVEGEPDSVSARSYVDALLTTPNGELIAQAIGFYDDELRETADGWKIARRRFTPVRMSLGQP